MQLSTAAPQIDSSLLKQSKMSNPFDGKFTAFSSKLTAKNAESHAATVAAKSGEVFEDKPFSVEYRTVYRVAQVGQSFSQVITFTTTAALGVFATMHVVPLWWGVWVAVPLGLLFAFGVERVKRLTLAIASKHLLKYKTFGGVGVAACLVMCVSIAAALLGAKELPSVVYPKPARVTDVSTVEALTSDLNRVQADIEATTGKLAQGENWVAENRTLPRLQRERAALQEKRTAAAKEAAERADAGKVEAEAERVENIEKMQVYSVSAAIVAELVFLLCTVFVFYYLFRHYAEANEGSEAQGQVRAASSVRYSATANLATNDNRFTKIVSANVPQTVDKKNCAWCETPYIYAHKKQLYCCDKCRIDAWEARTGAKLKKGNV